MIKINVIVRHDAWFKYIKNPQEYLKKKIKKIQKDKFFKKNRTYNFNLLLSGSKQIKKLNKQFRNKNKETDILSFPNQIKKDLKKSILKDKNIFLGDMVINLSKIETKTSKIFKNHFNVLWVHGLLHLFGYDHKKNSSFKKMNFVEKKFLNKIK